MSHRKKKEKKGLELGSITSPLSNHRQKKIRDLSLNLSPLLPPTKLLSAPKVAQCMSHRKKKGTQAWARVHRSPLVELLLAPKVARHKHHNNKKTKMEIEFKFGFNFNLSFSLSSWCHPLAELESKTKKNQKMKIKQKNTRGMEEKNKQWYEAHT